jgi:hypothetical protein
MNDFKATVCVTVPTLATKKNPLDKSSTAGGSRSLGAHETIMALCLERMQILMTSISKQPLGYVDE